MFADGDMRNFDPENLVAVPHKLQAQLKACEYWDAESLEAAVAMCMLHTAIIDAKSAHKVCPICGRRFAEDARQRDTRLGKTVCCPDCAREGVAQVGQRGEVPQAKGLGGMRRVRQAVRQDEEDAEEVPRVHSGEAEALRREAQGDIPKGASMTAKKPISRFDAPFSRKTSASSARRCRISDFVAMTDGATDDKEESE